MKKTIKLLAAIALLTAGCDSQVGQQNVRNAFPNDEIVNVPGYADMFIIRATNNEIWFSQDSGSRGVLDVKRKVKLFNQPPQELK